MTGDDVVCIFDSTQLGFFLSNLDTSREIIQKIVIYVISVLYMGTNMNKFIPLPPAKMKHLEAAQHLFVLLMINTMMNTEMSSNTQHLLASYRKEISPDHVGSICGIVNQKKCMVAKKWHVIIIASKFYIIQFLLFVA
jgi:hypothetical protein